MRILTWNINGIRTLIQYYPWSIKKSYKEVLEELNADIVCFQETKITRAKLSGEIALIPGFDAYMTFTKVKQGYSGVATYVRQPLMPIAAEEGITGILFDETKPNARRVGHYPEGYTDDDLLAIDSEGRCVIVEFDMFVLLNLYCPHESSEERLPYKLLFNAYMEKRVRLLLKAGKNVIVAGDINIAHLEIDHCEPQTSMKNYGIDHYLDHPARKWFDNFLSPKGPMVDFCRQHHPHRKGMYTCWNTKLNCRPANYGTRIDYILGNSELLPWVQHAVIEPDIMGSDHCPVAIELREEIEQLDLVTNEKTIWRLRDRLEGPPGAEVPALCTKHMDEYSHKQRKLHNFFSTSTLAQTQATPSDEDDSPSSEVPTPNVMFPSPPGTNAPPETVTPTAITARTTVEKGDVVGPQDGAIETSAHKSANGPKRKSIASSGKSETKETKKGSRKMSAQPSLTAFFKSSSSQIKDEKSGQSQADQGPESENKLSHPVSPKPHSDPETASSIPAEAPDDALNWLPTSISDQYLASSSIDELQNFSIATNDDETKSKWETLFRKKPPPLCKVHGEPCKEYTVNKPGPNHGRKFWLCSRLVGPEYVDTPNGGRVRNYESRCNYFEWAQDSRFKGETADAWKRKFAQTNGSSYNGDPKRLKR
ncbi:hypothetical protein BZG36_00866 [Bifiguratus adelaidae]|uniref:DNA-(apurinic or apyrimidinic site) endonuclease n=1 Tax=Bifiguratus adelaidae TaxID=1938954 RepID=A0A261Y5E2_9FUNG|nr:hypothetical protein BZG36_00866 [Bifiguratus adelaidae]